MVKNKNGSQLFTFGGNFLRNKKKVFEKISRKGAQEKCTLVY